MSLFFATAAALVLSGAPDLGDDRYRAVTLEPLERKAYRVKNLDEVTGASGRCVREGVDATDGFETFWVQADCGGLRTTMVWKKDRTRMHVMVCAEDEEGRNDTLVAQRKRVAAEVKGFRAVTACVRNGRVELWGWVFTEADLKKLNKLVAKHQFDTVRSFVEHIAPE